MTGFLWREMVTKDTPVARSSHGLSVVGDTAYLLGGEYTARSPLPSTLHVLDLRSSSATWREVAVAAGSPPSARFGHGQASIGDCIYVFGGRAGTQIDEELMNDLHEFNTKTRVWRPVETSGCLPEARSFHRMVALGTKLYVFGGCPAQGRLADLHCWDRTSGVWSRLPASGMEGRGGAGLAVAGGKLLVLGGFAGREMADVWQFCPLEEEWSQLQATLEPACSVAVCVGLGPRILLFGGELGPSDRGHEGAGDFGSDTTLFTVETTVTATRVAQVGAGPEARGWSSAATWGEGRLVMMGGLTGDDTSPRRMMDVWIGQLQD